jgi:3-deoxy-manno-octulosonate cytidylyltransferase (CMP-KDO synthetase)
MTNEKEWSYAVVIPARYSSTRLPGKPLIKILGREMLLRTFDQCAAAVPRDMITILTDDDRIISICKDNEIQWHKSKKYCLTGTDRVAEFAESNYFDTYINVQGDEPAFNPQDLTSLLSNAQHQNDTVLCGYTEITVERDYFSSQCPKVVMREDDTLIYISRSSIPGNKSNSFDTSHRQVCAYAFPRNALLEFFFHGKKTKLESQEDVELLRFLELGYKVKMVQMSDQSVPVDTREDIIKAELRIKELGIN